MPNPVQGLPVTVNVTAHPPSASEPYTIDWCLQGQPWQGNTPIVLPRGSGSHDMTFNLIDDSGKGLAFKPTAAEAMWTARGNNCPTGKGSGNGQMTYGSVTNGGMTLGVNDDNSGNPARLYYMLRFDPDPNVFDPEIRNGGTGLTPPSTIAATIGAAVGVAATILFTEAVTTTNVLIGAVIGAVIGYIAGLLLKGMRERSDGAPG